MHAFIVAIAALIGVAWSLAWWWRRQRALAVAALAWWAYAGYESLMLLRIACSGECNIRVDLLLRWPLLLGLTSWALRRMLRPVR